MEEAPAASAPPEEPKTETTLTTRIRINIPGSRPIPPVVVRKPVADAAPDVQAKAQAQAQAKAQAQAQARVQAPVAEPEPPRPEPVPEPEPVAPAEPPRAEEKPTSDWFAPRKPAGAAPAPKPAAAPALPPGPVTPATPAPAAAAPGFAGGSASDGVPSTASTTQSMPIVTPLTGGPGHTPAGGTPVFDPGAGNPLYDSGPGHTPAAGTPVVTPPAGPTTGPVTGGSPVVGPGHPRGGAPANGMPGMPGMTDALRMSDDTAILTPQSPAPHDGAHASGATLTSGMQAVTPGAAPRIPERQDPAFDGGHGSYDEPDAYDEPAPAPARKPAPAPAKKGRSKLVLAGVGVVVLTGLAYGAGLLLNHSDVPKGTTVLGVDIGGGTKEEAVGKLEAALGKRAHAPLRLDVGGRKTELAPDKAGLALDAQETVRAAAGSDYNPMSVIGSLFGGARVAQPVFPVDEEKLGVALTDLAGSSGSATEGTIVFSPGKVTAVEGKPGKGLDVQRSMIAVKDAYRAQVETGTAKSVALPVVTRQPTVTKAELDRAMKEFAEPAMSGLIRIKAGPKHIDFGPARSLPKILSMRAVDGKLVEVYDKEAITDLLDGVFTGVMITKGDGSKHEVSADDVAFVMRDALRGKGLTERTRTIDLSGEG